MSATSRSDLTPVAHRRAGQPQQRAEVEAQLVAELDERIDDPRRRTHRDGARGGASAC